MTDVLLDGAELRPGLRVLDVACGAGIPSRDEAVRVGPTGSVIGLDLSVPQLELARRFAADEHLDNLSYQEGNAEKLPFEDRTFDRVTSRFGPMFFPHLDVALGEARRVLRPGGILAWLVWGPIQDQGYFTGTALVAQRTLGLDRLPPEAAQPFKFGDGGILGPALERAGFRDVRETMHRVGQSWAATPETLADNFWNAPPPPFQPMLSGLSERERATATAESVEWFRERSDGHTVRLSSTVWLVRGTVG